ncbi:unnamed protein product [Closterium sp. Yama58-4]|nr:unnamed protein product [Closterium sp. Yama58-4]
MRTQCCRLACSAGSEAAGRDQLRTRSSPMQRAREARGARGRLKARINGAPRTCFSARAADSSCGCSTGGSPVAAAAADVTAAGGTAGCDSIERIAELIRRTHAPERDARGSAGHEEGAAERGSTAVDEGHGNGPLQSLEAGRWVKLICGASFEDVADVRNLAFIYTLAGVDCIDCAADPAVVAAARDGISAAMAWAARTLRDGPVYGVEAAAAQRDGRVGEAAGELRGGGVGEDAGEGLGDGRVGGGDVEGGRRPWVMAHCIAAWHAASGSVMSSMPHLPLNHNSLTNCSHSLIHSPPPPFSLPFPFLPAPPHVCVSRLLPPLPPSAAEEHQRTEQDTLALLRSGLVDAIEIHTLPGHVDEFNALWASIGEAAGALKLVAVSLPDLGDSMPAAMHAMHRTMLPHLTAANLWQLDGRPMSGDIGAGATRAAIRLAARVAAIHDRPPGYLQIAGGTNSHTFTALQQQGLLPASASDPERKFAGVAFGGHARKILAPVLAHLEAAVPTSETTAAAAAPAIATSMCPSHIESHPPLLLQALDLACALVHPYKLHSLT